MSVRGPYSDRSPTRRGRTHRTVRRRLCALGRSWRSFWPSLVVALVIVLAEQVVRATLPCSSGSARSVRGPPIRGERADGVSCPDLSRPAEGSCELFVCGPTRRLQRARPRFARRTATPSPASSWFSRRRSARRKVRRAVHDALPQQPRPAPRCCHSQASRMRCTAGPGP
jgi:hypothetical protein